MATSTPIAFLLSKFKDSTDEPMTKAAAENMFTAAGRGTMNVVDWFDDNSHGSIDMSGNVVVDWSELSDTVDEYRAKRTNGTYNRTKIIDLGRAAAASKVTLSDFVAHVIVTNIEVDLFGGVGYAVCTAATANKPVREIQVAPSVLCQEMIHGLGAMEHARRDGSDVDYADPYDVMSLFGDAKNGVDPTNPNLPVGPGLNAAFMKRLGWLDATRKAPSGMSQVKLRPLHRRDLPGSLYSLVGNRYVEYRASQRWDNGFKSADNRSPRSIVLVHYMANYTSYLCAELDAGEEYKWGSPSAPYLSQGSIKVDAIDDANEAATITTSYQGAWWEHHFPRPGPLISLDVLQHHFPLAGPVPSLMPRDEWVDTSGIVIINGRLVRIPPHSPEFRIAEAAAELASIGEVRLAPALGTQARTDVYGRLLADIGETHHHLTHPESPYDYMNEGGSARALYQQRHTKSRKKSKSKRPHR